MKQRIIAGNWKMKTTVSQAMDLAKDLMELDSIDGLTKIIVPPFVCLYPVNQVFYGSSIQLGAQNMYFEDGGPFTGEVSPSMLKDLCDFVILGHSERRYIFKETDNLINKKMQAAQSSGLIPILCVGETGRERDSGKTCDAISRQMALDLKNIDPLKPFIIAYEPVWAIGAGKPAPAAEAANTIGFIRAVIADTWNSNRADEVPILYGGTSSPDNISELSRQNDIDGMLVGKASLNARDFITMAHEMSAVQVGII